MPQVKVVLELSIRIGDGECLCVAIGIDMFICLRYTLICLGLVTIRCLDIFWPLRHFLI